MVLQEVALVGGPYDGDIRLVEPNRNVMLIFEPAGVQKRLYGGVLRDVPQHQLAATYRRISDDLFEHCRDHTAMGEGTDLEFYEGDLP